MSDAPHIHGLAPPCNSKRYLQALLMLDFQLGVRSVPVTTVAMATEEWVKRAIENSKTYEELPPRVRTVLPVAEWKAKYE